MTGEKAQEAPAAAKARLKEGMEMASCGTNVTLTQKKQQVTQRRDKTGRRLSAAFSSLEK